MDKNKKKIFMFIGAVLLLILCCFWLISFKNSNPDADADGETVAEDLPNDSYTTDSYTTESTTAAGIDDEDIDRIIESTDLENEIKNTDDMEDKLGFSPPVIEETQDDLRLVLVSYTGEHEGYIDEKLEETPKEDVKGIRFLYFSKDPDTFGEIWLMCREADEIRETYAEGEQVTEEYKGINILCGEKNILLVSDENYESLSSSNAGFDYMSDPENDGEFAPFTICEWTSGDIDYKLMGKYISDKDLMIKYAKEFIDEMEK